MLKLLVVVAGFAIGSAFIAAALALPSSSATPASRANAATAIMSAAEAPPASMSNEAAAVKLTIQHVQKGCHVWSNGTMTAASTMRLQLKRGQELTISDMDVDAHQLIELSGPSRIATGAPLTMGHERKFTFTKKGVYRLGTRTVEPPGAAMDVKTTGLDHKLRLVVAVA